MSQHELSEYAEATGTLLNAYTSREHTSYYFQGRRDNTEKLVEILADVIQKPDLSRYCYELYINPAFSLICCKLGSAPDPTKWTDRSVSVGSVTSPTDPTLGLRIEIGRLVGGRVNGRSVAAFWSVGGRVLVGFTNAF